MRVCVSVCVCARGVGVWGWKGRSGEYFVSIWCDAGAKVVCLLVDFFFSLTLWKQGFTLLARYCGIFWRKCEIVWKYQKFLFTKPISWQDFSYRSTLDYYVLLFLCVRGNATGLNYHKISSIRAKGNIVLPYSAIMSVINKF